MNRPLRGFVASDIHIPYHDKRLVESVFFDFVPKNKFDVIFLNGDVIDNYALSRYAKIPGSKSFMFELDNVREFLIRLRAKVPKTRIVFIEGNHEFRFEAYMRENAPELYGVTSLEKLLGLKELRIEYVRSKYKENWVKWHNLYIGHFDACASLAGSTAQKLLKDKGVSLIQGHIHRIGMSAKRLLDRTIYAYENPCLARLDQDYVRHPDWQQGFSVVYASGNKTWVTPIPIQGYQYIVEGVLYQA